MRFRLLGILILCSSLSVLGQTVSDSALTIVKQLDDIEVIQQRTASFVEQTPQRLVVNMSQLQFMPKFLGTSDPIRYMQSLPG